MLLLLFLCSCSVLFRSTSATFHEIREFVDFLKVGAKPRNFRPPPPLKHYKNSVIPKEQTRIDVQQFKSNDIPFIPSERIPLNPTLAQRSGAIRYVNANPINPEKLVAQNNFLTVHNSIGVGHETTGSSNFDSIPTLPTTPFRDDLYQLKDKRPDPRLPNTPFREDINFGTTASAQLEHPGENSNDVLDSVVTILNSNDIDDTNSRSPFRPIFRGEFQNKPSWSNGNEIRDDSKKKKKRKTKSKTKSKSTQKDSEIGEDGYKVTIQIDGDYAPELPNEIPTTVYTYYEKDREYYDDEEDTYYNYLPATPPTAYPPPFLPDSYPSYPPPPSQEYPYAKYPQLTNHHDHQIPRFPNYPSRPPRQNLNYLRPPTPPRNHRPEPEVKVNYDIKKDFFDASFFSSENTAPFDDVEFGAKFKPKGVDAFADDHEHGGLEIYEIFNKKESMEDVIEAAAPGVDPGNPNGILFRPPFNHFQNNKHRSTTSTTTPTTIRPKHMGTTTARNKVIPGLSDLSYAYIPRLPTPPSPPPRPSTSSRTTTTTTLATTATSPMEDGPLPTYRIPAPPSPPAPPSIPPSVMASLSKEIMESGDILNVELNKLELEDVVQDEIEVEEARRKANKRRRRNKNKNKTRKKKKKKKKGKRRRNKKDTPEKPSKSTKRSLSLQYKVLDFINRTAYWSTIVGVIAAAVVG